MADGLEFQVNTTVANTQEAPVVAGLSDGGFVTVWHSYDGTSWDVFAQRYDAARAPVGGEFRVNTQIAGGQNAPAVAALAGGGFVVSWTSATDAYGHASHIFAQRFDAAGTAVGSEFRVNAHNVAGKRASSLTALADGGFVATWQSYAQDGSEWGVYGQRFDAAGTTVGAEFRANTTTYDHQQMPSVTALGDGGFVVSWISQNQDGSDQGVYAQLYAAAGAPVGAEFRVNTTTVNLQTDPAVVGLSGGGFVVTWHGQGAPDGQAVYAQLYDAAGAAVGTEFLVNTDTYDCQYAPAVTALGDGGFVVTWAGRAHGDEFVRGQRFDAAGTKVGTEFQANTTGAGKQNAPAVAAVAGGVAVVWQSDGQDGSGLGIYGTFLPINAAPSGSDTTVTVLEDTAYTFAVADFGFTDPDSGDALSAVRVDTLPAAGSLTLNGTAITAGTVVGAADIAAGKLTFVPAADANGAGHASFTFSVRDTAGPSFAAVPKTLTVDVTAVNDAPTLSATGAAATFTEGGAAVALFAGTSLSAGETGQDITAVTLTVANLADGSHERLVVDGTDVVLTHGFSGATAGGQGIGYAVARNGSTATVTLSKTAGTAAWAGYIDALRYRNTSVDPTAATNRVVTLTSVTDSGGSANGGIDTTPLAVAASVTVNAVASSEFQVNTTVANTQEAPVVAGLSDGGFVTVWHSYDGTSWDVFAQRYDAA
ncbi:MAG TPA: hypothetical protein VEB64_16820, partial [Azospirillaceae bacterium]|nr:hypothetical protein [Azospirillaceae bacterium]